MMLTILITILAITFTYFYIINYFSYWKRKKVSQKSVIRVITEILSYSLSRKILAEIVAETYNEFRTKRYCGLYALGIPTLLIRDTKLIKQLTVKDFDHFIDHKTLLADVQDPVLKRNVFTLKGEEWRQMRAKLSPNFTSNKMKIMFNLMSESGQNFIEFFSAKANDKLLTVDIKDSFTRYTTDVIANAIFGIKCDLLRERNNEFYLMGLESTKIFNVKNLIKFFILSQLPKVAKLFNITIINSKIEDFFVNIVSDSIKQREENKIVRPDMINILLEARKGNVKDDLEVPETGFATVKEYLQADNKLTLSNLDITAQTLIFFIGGFETVSKSMGFVAYELAVNPHIQEKLIKEIDQVLTICENKLTYEALMKMKYLDMVISETLRLWPIAMFLDRLCVKPYTIQPEFNDEQPLKLQKGDIIWFPVFGLHRDPEFYPNPEKFDPERFNDDNKVKIKPYTYLPFGVGPRNCIGSRFALMEIKLLIFYILTTFELVPVDKTQIPLKLSKKSLLAEPEKDVWIGFKPRHK